MVGFIVLLVILFLAAPVLAIVALVNASGISDGLRRLERRVAALENRPEPVRTTTEPPPLQVPSPSPAPPSSPLSPPPRQPAAASVPSKFTRLNRRVGAGHRL
jgi:hypothetical protein